MLDAEGQLHLHLRLKYLIDIVVSSEAQGAESHETRTEPVLTAP